MYAIIISNIKDITMQLELTRQEFADIIDSALSSYNMLRPRKPAFIIESLYLNFFDDLIKVMPVPKDGNFIGSVQPLLEKLFSETIMDICKILGKHPVDGSAIWAFMSERRIILRRDQQQYNKQLPRKTPKGIPSELWHDYNHWLIAINLWNGFVKSLQPSFSIAMPPDSDDPLELLLLPEFKPLWGMWEAYNELGRPFFTMDNCGNSIYVKPWVSLVKYRKQLKEGK